MGYNARNDEIVPGGHARGPLLVFDGRNGDRSRVSVLARAAISGTHPRDAGYAVLTCTTSWRWFVKERLSGSCRIRAFRQLKRLPFLHA